MERNNQNERFPSLSSKDLEIFRSTLKDKYNNATQIQKRMDFLRDSLGGITNPKERMANNQERRELQRLLNKSFKKEGVPRSEEINPNWKDAPELLQPSKTDFQGGEVTASLPSFEANIKLPKTKPKKSSKFMRGLKSLTHPTSSIPKESRFNPLKQLDVLSQEEEEKLIASRSSSQPIENKTEAGNKRVRFGESIEITPDWRDAPELIQPVKADSLKGDVPQAVSPVEIDFGEKNSRKGLTRVVKSTSVTEDVLRVVKKGVKKFKGKSPKQKGQNENYVIPDSSTTIEAGESNSYKTLDDAVASKNPVEAVAAANKKMKGTTPVQVKSAEYKPKDLKDSKEAYLHDKLGNVDYSNKESETETRSTFVMPEFNNTNPQDSKEVYLRDNLGDIDYSNKGSNLDKEESTRPTLTLKNNQNKNGGPKPKKVTQQEGFIEDNFYKDESDGLPVEKENVGDPGDSAEFSDKAMDSIANFTDSIGDVKASGLNSNFKDYSKKEALLISKIKREEAYSEESSLENLDLVAVKKVLKKAEAVGDIELSGSILENFPALKNDFIEDTFYKDSSSAQPVEKENIGTPEDSVEFSDKAIDSIDKFTDSIGDVKASGLNSNFREYVEREDSINESIDSKGSEDNKGGAQDADLAPLEPLTPEQDAVASADIYLAYGRPEEAADKVKKALKSDPENANLIEKLKSIDDTDRGLGLGEIFSDLDTDIELADIDTESKESISSGPKVNSYDEIDMSTEKGSLRARYKTAVNAYKEKRKLHTLQVGKNRSESRKELERLSLEISEITKERRRYSLSKLIESNSDYSIGKGALKHGDKERLLNKELGTESLGVFKDTFRIFMSGYKKTYGKMPQQLKLSLSASLGAAIGASTGGAGGAAIRVASWGIGYLTGKKVGDFTKGKLNEGQVKLRDGYKNELSNLSFDPNSEDSMQKIEELLSKQMDGLNSRDMRDMFILAGTSLTTALIAGGGSRVGLSQLEESISTLPPTENLSKKFAGENAKTLEAAPVVTEASSVENNLINTTYEIKDGQGAISAFVDLKKDLKKIPEGQRSEIVNKILDTRSDELAKNYGFWNPAADATDISGKESANLIKGDKLSLNDEGQFVYEKADGKFVVLEDGEDTSTIDGKFGDEGGEMFNYQKETTAPAETQIEKGASAVKAGVSQPINETIEETVGTTNTDESSKPTDASIKQKTEISATENTASAASQESVTVDPSKIAENPRKVLNLVNELRGDRHESLSLGIMMNSGLFPNLNFDNFAKVDYLERGEERVGLIFDKKVRDVHTIKMTTKSGDSFLLLINRDGTRMAVEGSIFGGKSNYPDGFTTRNLGGRLDRGITFTGENVERMTEFMNSQINLKDGSIDTYRLHEQLNPESLREVETVEDIFGVDLVSLLDLKIDNVSTFITEQYKGVSVTTAGDYEIYRYENGVTALFNTTNLQTLSIEEKNGKYNVVEIKDKNFVKKVAAGEDLGLEPRQIDSKEALQKEILSFIK